MNNIYYNMNKLMSFNAIYNFVLGERGNGKTFCGKKKMIELFLRKGKQSVYVRRTKSELIKIKDNLFDDIRSHYPDLEITVKGYQAFINGEIFCHFIPLSTANQFKSASFPLVEFIFFDEYILTHTGYNHYIKNEMEVVHGLVETIFRRRLPCVYFASNNVSYVNPFFLYFDIQPKPNDKFIKIKQNGNINVVVEITDTQDYRSEKKKDRFSQMLQGTKYSEHAFNNGCLEDNNEFILEKRPSDFNYFRGAYRFNNQIIGCWSQGALDSGVWFGSKFDKNSNWKYTLYNNDNYVGWKNIKIDRNNYNIKYIKKCFLNGSAYYQDQNTKKFFCETVSKFI